MTEQTETQQENPAAKTAEEINQVSGVPAQAPFKVFATQEEYQQYFDKILGQRLKSARKKSEKMEGREKVLQPISSTSPNRNEREAGIAASLAQETAKLAERDNALYGGIDAETLAADKKFLTLLSHGFSVKEAYDALHLEEISRKLAERANRQAISNIMARGIRPQENAAFSSAAGAYTTNVSDMSSEEIDAVLDRARRGESITF